MIGRSRPTTELPERLQALANAADLGLDRLPADSIDNARQLAQKGDERLRHGSETTMVALVGATGSGKSSLTNLMAGRDITTAGIRRPTTSSTLACIFGGTDAGRVLDWLEIDARHYIEDPGELQNRESLEGLVLLDVPDFDSIETAHRDEMERVAGKADVLVWVTDPEKYADKAMHSYLAGLAGHGAVMAVVLNKIDLLSEDDANVCQRDLAELLGRQGLEEAPVLATSAETGFGRFALEAFLSQAVSSKRAAIDRISANIDQAARALQGHLGDQTGPQAVSDRVRARLRDDLLAVSGIDVVTDAVSAGYRRDASRRGGWPFTRWRHALRPHPLRRFRLGADTSGRTSLPQPSGIERARINGAIRTAADRVTEDLPQPWPHHVLQAGTPDEIVLADRIDQAVAAAVRDGVPKDPRWWQLADIVQTILALAAVAGGVWLALLALVAYLRLPEVPTPYWPEPFDALPIPTTLLVGGFGLGLVCAAIVGRLAHVGAARRARRVRKQAAEAIDEVAGDMIVEPMDAELARRGALATQLSRARAPST